MAIKSINDTTVLNNEVEMPWLGFGVFQIPEGQEVEQSVSWALETGYRSIDTAAAYGNETGVGKAIRASGIPREEVFVTTKVWNSDQGYDSTLAAFNTSLEKLAMDYVDLYLIHWPVEGKYKETWRALEEIYQSGRARAIGVSNFLSHHLKDLMQDSDTVPTVNQVEFHPYLQQPDLQAFCRENRIQLEAWSPLIKGEVVDVPELVELGEKYGKSPAQITLRWMVQHRVVTIPKSVHKNRIQENADIFDFELEAEDMKVIDGLDRHHRTGPDPDDFDL